MFVLKQNKLSFGLIVMGVKIQKGRGPGWLVYEAQVPTIKLELKK